MDNSKEKEEKIFLEEMKQKGKLMKRERTAYSILSEAEKIFVNTLIKDPCQSYGNAVLNCGLADNVEDAMAIGISLLNNDRIKKAVDEIKILGGITPSIIKEGILNLAKNSQDENIQLKAWQMLGKYEGLENIVIKTLPPARIEDPTEIKERVTNRLGDFLGEAEAAIMALQAAEYDKDQDYKKSLEDNAGLNDDD